jgi:orotidine-5'-phosphate decarboxylase
MIRRELGEKLMVVTPGIRPVENKPVDDQKRTVDVAQAFRNGADYIVVGRPIRQGPAHAAHRLIAITAQWIAQPKAVREEQTPCPGHS